MQIDVLRLIEDALLSGRYGKMEYIYNNPLIGQIYAEWQISKQSNNTFKDFLLECLNTKQENSTAKTKTTYNPITKTYDVYDYDEKYKEYKKIEKQINDLEREQDKILKEIAESKNKTLADISTYKLESNQYGKYIEFKILVEEITKIDTGIKE